MMCDDIDRLLRDAEKWKDSGLLMPACAPAVLALAARLAEAEALLREASNWRMAIECVAPELGGAIMTLNRIDAFLAPDSASLSGNYCPHCDSALANPCDAAAAKTCPNRLADADQPGEAVNVR